ncbi:hypothetical protein AEA09_11345 [Lysinibacillus contaminans]|uniref:Uncharacterized protein n=1 Tax=Lysinibacillus contaminans TaxID=1293441 RepID=A0ABR5K2D2_9BACI|nr:hypothetical protein [Lysinibacillus contaminans]KOS69078.1 hypothetical protein AEA09_11345 [Lysinibacillus contaminans]
MRKSFHQTLSMLAICLLLSQAFLGSLPVFAETSSNVLTITMTENGQPYVEGSVATSPVTIQVAASSPDSAGIELSQDFGATWKSYDSIVPLVLEDAGGHDIWFKATDAVGQTVIEKRRIQIAVAPLLLSQSTSVATADSATIYVNQASTGTVEDGISWATAYKDLQKALTKATDGNQIWIAKGTYIPTKPLVGNDSRTASFQMKNGVAIYGGFNGTEVIREQRDFAVNETILSGDIGTAGDNTDNTYHVFYHSQSSNLDIYAILDSITINGSIVDMKVSYGLHSSGSGMYNHTSIPH